MSSKSTIFATKITTKEEKQMAGSLNLNNVPAELKAAIEEHYADCPSLKELADSFGITVSRLHNIAHAMHVPRSLEARSRDSSVRSTINRHRFPDYLT